jgi:Flp pilus assembly protein TadD
MAEMMKVSLSMIVRNEEANLAACLRSAADLVDEIVVVDTGSTDRTKEIAVRFSARVFDFTWCDDFSAARNASADHCTGDWLFILDADDVIDETNRQLLKKLFSELKDENAGYLMNTALVSNDRAAKLVDHVRLFRRHPKHRFRYRVHEQIHAAIVENGGRIHRTNIRIDHLGYRDPAIAGEKAERNLRLMMMDYAQQPNNPDILLMIGKSHLTRGKPAEAIPFLRRCLELAPASGSIHADLYGFLGSAYQQAGDKDKALSVYCEGAKRHPGNAELLSKEGFLRCQKGDVSGAEACLVRVLDGNTSANLDPRLRTATHFNLALLYHQQSRAAEAEEQYRAVLQLDPAHGDAKKNLAILLARAQK